MQSYVEGQTAVTGKVERCEKAIKQAVQNSGDSLKRSTQKLQKFLYFPKFHRGTILLIFKNFGIQCSVRLGFKIQ